nr:PREDICTED: uncharacterized protein LOC106482199 [Apteryx mantelli mantelli]
MDHVPAPPSQAKRSAEWVRRGKKLAVSGTGRKKAHDRQQVRPVTASKNDYSQKAKRFPDLFTNIDSGPYQDGQQKFGVILPGSVAVHRAQILPLQPEAGTTWEPGVNLLHEALSALLPSALLSAAARLSLPLVHRPVQQPLREELVPQPQRKSIQAGLPRPPTLLAGVTEVPSWQNLMFIYLRFWAIHSLGRAASSTGVPRTWKC